MDDGLAATPGTAAAATHPEDGGVGRGRHRTRAAAAAPVHPGTPAGEPAALRTRVRGMRKLWLVALLFLAVACGGTSSTSASPGQPEGSPSGAGTDHPSRPTAPSPDAVVSGAPAAPPGAPSGTPSPVTPAGPTLNPRKVPWESATPASDGRSLDVVWWSGVEPCHVLDHVEVTETARTVTVTLYEGQDRRSPDAVCIEIAVLKTTKVRLKAPLGGRKVVDGAE